MPANSESQCYFIQLQIDGYLDGDLSDAQRTLFMSHVQGCAACAKQFHFAQAVQDAVLDLPRIDCDDSVLEPVYRLGKNTGQQTSTASQLPDFLHAITCLVSLRCFRSAGLRW